MACFAPVKAWPSLDGKPVFNRREGYLGPPLLLPCGGCAGCQLARKRDWATRGWCELKMVDEAIAVTSTYAPAYLPEDHSVSTRDSQLLLKLVRKHFPPADPSKGGIKFIACLEYGERFGRPHMHHVFFNLGLPPDVKVAGSSSGRVMYSSKMWERVWPKGHHQIGPADLGAIGYIAGYVTKKINNRFDPDAWKRIDTETGQVFVVERERILCSKGIGERYWERYGDHAAYWGFIVIDGQKRPLPRYFLKMLTDDQRMRLALQHKAYAHLHAADATPARLAVRNEIAEHKFRPRVLAE